eukprot:1319913-Alexandrium_andersonii.AAC.1
MGRRGARRRQVRDHDDRGEVPRGARPPPELEVGQKLTGAVASPYDYGAFVDIGPRQQGSLGTSRVAEERFGDIHDHLKVGQEVQ